MAPKTGSGYSPHVQKTNDPATMDDELLKEIAQDFKSVEKTTPKVAQKLADIANKNELQKFQKIIPQQFREVKGSKCQPRDLEQA